MVVPDKKLAPGEIRFLARKVDKFWRVYDRVRGSFPYHNKDLGGAVLQDVSEKEAQVEADRLNEMFVEKAPVKKRKKKASAENYRDAMNKPLELSEQDEEAVADLLNKKDVVEDVWVSEEDIPDYGVMDEETAKKYVEGIL